MQWVHAVSVRKAKICNNSGQGSPSGSFLSKCCRAVFDDNKTRIHLYCCAACRLNTYLGCCIESAVNYMYAHTHAARWVCDFTHRFSWVSMQQGISINSDWLIQGLSQWWFDEEETKSLTQTLRFIVGWCKNKLIPIDFHSNPFSWNITLPTLSRKRNQPKGVGRISFICEGNVLPIKLRSFLLAC